MYGDNFNNIDKGCPIPPLAPSTVTLVVDMPRRDDSEDARVNVVVVVVRNTVAVANENMMAYIVLDGLVLICCNKMIYNDQKKRNCNDRTLFFFASWVVVKTVSVILQKCSLLFHFFRLYKACALFATG